MSTRRYGDQIGRAELSGLPQQPHATGSRAANMTDFRVGYDFGYGDGQVGEYQPEKHRAAHATPDRAATNDWMLLALRYEEALRLIAVGKRADGTYNRGREACEQLARKALGESR